MEKNNVIFICFLRQGDCNDKSSLFISQLIGNMVKVEVNLISALGK